MKLKLEIVTNLKNINKSKNLNYKNENSYKKKNDNNHNTIIRTKFVTK